MKMETGWIVLALCVTIAVTFLGSMAIYHRHVETMAELGYEEVVLPGSSITVWRKAGEKDIGK